MPILDEHGNPISAKPPATTAGGAVNVRQSSFQYPISGLTPGKLVSILREADDGYMDRQAELFAEMEERDGHLLSQLEIRRLALAGLEWRVVPADSSTQATKIADAFSEWWATFDQSDLILDCADAITQGVNITAMAWDRGGGLWTPGRFEQIKPSDLKYDSDAKRFAVLTRDAPLGEFLPFGAGIEHRARARAGSPTRAGLGRTIAWWYLFKHYGVKDWLVFAELFGVPFRVGKYDPATSDDERKALIAAVRGLGTDAAGVISKDTEIEIIEVAKQGGADVFEKLLNLCDREISKAVLGQTLTSSEGQHGTQALGNVHQRVRFDIRDSDAKRLAPTLRRDLLQPFAVFNFGQDAFSLAPKIVPILEEPEDLGEKAKTLTALQGLGLEIPEAWVRETFGVPDVKKGERTLSRAAPIQPATPADNTAALEAIWGARPVQRVSLERQTRAPATGLLNGQLYATAVMDEATGANAFGGVLERIAQIAASSDGYDNLRQNLIAAFPELDSTALAKLLEASITLGDLAGRYAMLEDVK